MKRAIAAVLAAAVIAGAAAPVTAKGPPNGCPPGLAKKSPACIPPGLAKKQYAPYRGDYRDGDHHRGDRLPDWYNRIDNPGDYGLQVLVNGSDYFEHDGVIYRVNTKTRKVLELFRAVDAVAN